MGIKPILVGNFRNVFIIPRKVRLVEITVKASEDNSVNSHLAVLSCVTVF